MNGFYITAVLMLQIVDPPPLQAAELYTWMGRDVAKEGMSFNRHYQSVIHAHRLFYPEQCQVELQEACKLYRIYDAIDDCHSSNKAIVQAGLIRLREQLGVEAFWSGKIPPPIPLWSVPIRHD